MPPSAQGAAKTKSVLRGVQPGPSPDSLVTNCRIARSRWGNCGFSARLSEGAGWACRHHLAHSYRATAIGLGHERPDHILLEHRQVDEVNASSINRWNSKSP